MRCKEINEGLVRWNSQQVVVRTSRSDLTFQQSLKLYELPGIV